MFTKFAQSVLYNIHTGPKTVKLQNLWWK